MGWDEKVKAKLRNRIQEHLDQAHEERKKEMFKRRVDLAKSGLQYYEAGKIREAVQSFQTYIRILEDWKKVDVGGLNPSLFDPKKDGAELLLISGVYWDLVKTFDRAKSPKGQAEFRQYLNKFIIFTYGMAHQGICAETMRKYIANEKAVHTAVLKEAYKKIAVTKCFIATELVDHCRASTTPVLRRYRDDRLSKNHWGRCLVGAYVFIAPLVARGIGRCPVSIKRFIARGLDRMAQNISGELFPFESDGR